MDHDRTAAIHDALGSEVRLRLVELVAAHKEMCACELVDQLGLSQATISRHVAVLRHAGILQSRRVESYALLRVNPQVLEEVYSGVLARIRALHASSAELDVEARLLERCSEPQTA
jgi:ArsR family transcriptional regulator, arsenate/arsenite/antimonite-responsive transcriptional repressor